MSITSALNSAMSGLSATSRMADVTANNVANALNEGYARREVQLSASSRGKGGGGVSIDGIARRIDSLLLQDLRLASSAMGGRATASDFLSRVDDAMGTADKDGSLSARVFAFERSLVEAAARPEADARLAAVLDAARSMTQGMNQISETIRSERQSADTRIGQTVGQLNDALAGVAELNLRIRSFAAAGRETSALKDQRQQLVDSISQIVPVREALRSGDQIALYTTGGTILLEGQPVQIGFAPTTFVTAGMSLAAGTLSGLTLNGKPLTTSPAGGRLGEGRLSALFDLRDRQAPEAQANLDALARDLIDRLADPAVDPTLTAGAAGLFTDANNAPLNPANEAGLAGRIQLNTTVDPDAGGALWRLRDGLGAPAAGPPGYSVRLGAIAGALSATRPQASGTLPPGDRSLSGFVSDIASTQSVKRLSAEDGTAFASARAEGLRTALLREGVDTEQEMQNLLVIEQSYAANAKVIQTVDELINILLGL